MADVEFVDRREQFRNKKKAKSLYAKTALALVADNNSEAQSKLARSRSIPGFETQVHNAVMLDDVKALRTLLAVGGGKHERELNTCGPQGITPLHRACAGGNLQIVRMLLEAGSDVTLRSKEGKSPLNMAVAGGHFELSEFLLQNGAKADEIKDGVNTKL